MDHDRDSLRQTRDPSPREPGTAGAPARAGGRPASPAGLLRLQRTAGNASVTRLLLRAEESAEAGPVRAPGSGSLLIDDEAEPAAPGQMRRSTFLAELRTRAGDTARATLAGSPQAAMVDTALEQWMGTLTGVDAAALERRIRTEVPAARAALGARDYVEAICAAIRLRLEQQAAAEASEAGEGGSALGGLASAASSVASGVAGAVGSLASMLFKRRGAGAAVVERSTLGRGAPLDGATRGRMEAVLGSDLSAVRVHTDARAQAIASARGALGFAIGTDVGFGAGQYRPGSPVGDALIAHELAHAVQQRDASAPADGASVGALEAEADEVAVAAGARALDERQPAATRARPLLRSRLRLLSCAPAKAPTDPHGKYEFWVKDGAERLHEAKFGTPLATDLDDKFDREFWEWQTDTREIRILRVKSGKRPSDAIRALFEHMERWRVDCARLVQLAHLWARLNTFGPDAFDAESPVLELRGRGSTGVKTRAHFGRNGPGDAWHDVVDVTPGKEQITLGPTVIPGATTQLVDAAPIGSRVRWTNLNAKPDDSFRHENTIKVGRDAFAAHPYGTVSEAEVVERLAKHATDLRDPEQVRRNIFIDEIEQFDTP